MPPDFKEEMRKWMLEIQQFKGETTTAIQNLQKEVITLNANITDLLEKIQKNEINISKLTVKVGLIIGVGFAIVSFIMNKLL